MARSFENNTHHNIKIVLRNSFKATIIEMIVSIPCLIIYSLVPGLIPDVNRFFLVMIVGFPIFFTIEFALEAIRYARAYREVQIDARELKMS